MDKQHIQEKFPNRRLIASDQLSEELRNGELFGLVQCDLELPEYLMVNFSDFPPIFKIFFVRLMIDVG